MANMFVEKIVLRNVVCIFNTFFNITYVFLKVYCLSNFVLNRANKQYNRLPHEFEINLTTNTVIYQIHDETYINVNVSFHFTKMSSISLTDIGKMFW